MNSPTTMIKLADARIVEADFLCKNGYIDIAYYLAGYAIELYLKARIAILLNMPNFFDFENRSKLINEDSITKPYKVHNFEQLLVLSGLFPEHKKMLQNENYKENWGVIRNWKEDARYDIGKDINDAQDFINSVKYYTLWINQYL